MIFFVGFDVCFFSYQYNFELFSVIPFGNHYKKNLQQVYNLISL